MFRIIMSAGMTLALSGSMAAQSMVEHAAAAAAGSTAGAVAGKKVSNGLTKVFQKVDNQTKTAAKADKKSGKQDPLVVVGPAELVPKGKLSAGHSRAGRKPGPARPVAWVAPPPPVVRAEAPVAPDLAAATTPVLHAPAPPAEPPPVTREALAAVQAGESGKEVLAKLGTPASTISMFDDGHFVEVLRYMSQETTLGVVRLSDGTVSSVQLARP